MEALCAANATWRRVGASACYGIVAIGDCAARLSRARRLEAAGLRLAKVIHSSSILASDVALGDGTFIGPGAIVNSAARAGRCVIINTGAIVEHECRIDDGAHICPGARLAGNVHVERQAWIGIGATVIENVHVGEGSIVGAGAVVGARRCSALRGVRSSGEIHKGDRVMSSRPCLQQLAISGAAPAFAKPKHVGQPNIGNRKELFRRLNAMLDRRTLTNNGPLVREFEERIASKMSVKHCIATSNATVALQLVIRALNVTGEVILPSFTFIATAHAAAWEAPGLSFATSTARRIRSIRRVSSH